VAIYFNTHLKRKQQGHLPSFMLVVVMMVMVMVVVVVGH
jgi:Tfp pilus assembly protein PilX